MSLRIRTLLLMKLVVASVMAQQVPKALEQGSSKNVTINTTTVMASRCASETASNIRRLLYQKKVTGIGIYALRLKGELLATPGLVSAR